MIKHSNWAFIETWIFGNERVAGLSTYSIYHRSIFKIFGQILGLGAVLEQMGEDGSHHPVNNASQQTNAAEAKHASTELKVNCCIGVLSYLLWSVYLLGNTFTVYKDHL